MRRRPGHGAAATAVAACLLAACSPAPLPQPAVDRSAAVGADTTLVIDNARVFDGERDLGVVALVIRNGIIERIEPAGVGVSPAETRRVDYRGHWVIPGLINAHAHVGNTLGTEHGDRFYTRDIVIRDLRQFQAYGITTVVALGLNGEGFTDIRDEVATTPALGAQLLGAGAGVGTPEGAPPAANMGLQRDAVARPADAVSAREAVRAQGAIGVDLIKLWVDDLGGKAPPMTAEVYRAAIDEAHRHGLLVAAHIHDLAPAADLVASGVDIIAHGVRDRPVDDALVAAMRAAGTGYIATLQIDEANYVYAEHPEWLETPFLRNALPAAVHARWSDPQWRADTLADPATQRARDAVAMNLRNLGTLRAAGIAIGFGTDAGALPHRVPGFAEHRELELMQQAGYSPQQALTVATRDSARLLRLEDRGLLAPGRRADFVVLGQDPLLDIRNTRAIEAVWQAGVQVGGPVRDYANE
ncbi:amidohydrolase family protein [Luteimonas deserti]|uniref:Amidohydrolase family protein n=1 Tax=Luteimonas deserti TaxID=2752306 RepID=A0A7Z0TVR8_9GAMM|nr:amidohydrolase family protein [Luteimonas deserti]NYZ64146.1 amidohydrolase family protein [Luteimonas deserti]